MSDVDTGCTCTNWPPGKKELNTVNTVKTLSYWCKSMISCTVDSIPVVEHESSQASHGQHHEAASELASNQRCHAKGQGHRNLHMQSDIYICWSHLLRAGYHDNQEGLSILPFEELLAGAPTERE